MADGSHRVPKPKLFWRGQRKLHLRNQIGWLEKREPRSTLGGSRSQSKKQFSVLWNGSVENWAFWTGTLSFKMPEVQQRSSCRLRVRRRLWNRISRREIAKGQSSLYEQTSAEWRSLPRTPPLKYFANNFYFLLVSHFWSFLFLVYLHFYFICLKLIS